MAKKPTQAMGAASDEATTDNAPQVVQVQRLGASGLPLKCWRAKAPTGEEMDIEADCLEDVVRTFNSRLDKGRTFTARSLQIECLGPAPTESVQVAPAPESPVSIPIPVPAPDATPATV